MNSGKEKILELKHGESRTNKQGIWRFIKHWKATYRKYGTTLKISLNYRYR